MEKINPSYVEKIDSNLSFVKKFPKGSLYVCQVLFGGKHHVLKIANKVDDRQSNHIAIEARALDLASDVSGITHMVKNYEVNSLCGGAILKEYFEGDSLLDIPNVSLNIERENELEETVRELHSLGIVDLDLRKANIVLSLNRQEARIIELGGSFYPNIWNGMPLLEFDKVKNLDLWTLKNL